MDRLVAVVHSAGVVINKGNSFAFYVLEFAYFDADGMSAKFFIRSPMSLKKTWDKADINILADSMDVFITTEPWFKNVPTCSFMEVVQFLQIRFAHFDQKIERAVFGYKGNAFQPKILNHAEVRSVNLEYYGCPVLNDLYKIFSPIVLAMYPEACRCRLHPRGRKCAFYKVLMLRLWSIHYLL
jgi:hypothetical protein